MPVAGGAFDQCYNAQAMVATESLLVIAMTTGRWDPPRLHALLGDMLKPRECTRAEDGVFKNENINSINRYCLKFTACPRQRPC